ncbi:hypothetical protein [Vibrio lentus]|uniref:hypothetical protein n=1 Tax=Vibrio lentus TaxID=136468 RepID=UPI000CACA9FF|nr:hypothetical protein [Vibrio lentus]PMM19648.1 repressor [Vibrio lentus]
MATKHIKDSTWEKVEKENVKAIIETKKSIKDTETLDFLINLGLSKITKDDYYRIKKT